MEILLYKRIVLNLKKVCERWKESKWRIEFGIFIYFLSGSYYNIFIYYNIITLCYIHYIWMIIWLCISNPIILS